MTTYDLTPARFANLYKGGETKLAPGRYVTGKPIIISGAKGFDLRGEGVTIVGQLEFLNCKDFRLSGFAFDGDRKARGDKWDKPTLRITGCSDWDIDNTEFVNARGDHLYIAGGSSNGIVEDSELDDAWRNAISVINGNHLTFDNLRIRNVNGTAPMAGIDIEANADDPLGCNHDIVIDACHISDVGGLAVYAPKNANPPARVTVTGCTLAGTVTLHGPDHRVEGNRIDGRGRAEVGIAIRGPRPTVRDNDLTNGKHYAVWVAGEAPTADDNRVTGYANGDGETAKVEEKE